MLMTLSRCAEELGLNVSDLVVLIRNLPGVPYILRGDTIYADPSRLGPFLTDHGIPVDERYADSIDGCDVEEDEDPEDDDDDGPDKHPVGGRRQCRDAKARR